MSSTPMRPGGAPVSHLIGRTGELTSLRAIADSSIEAGANLVIVSGDAGIGKSRVIRELLAQLRHESWQGHIGHCIEHAERPLPFGPIIQILRSLAEDLDQPGLDQIVGHRRGDLASLLPELGVDAIRGASLNGDVDRLLDAISATLTEAARRQPLALVVEDIHWSDAATRDLLASLVHSLGAAKVLLLVTERSGSADRGHPLRTWLAELRRLPNVASLALEGLTRQELAEQATGLLGRVPSNDLVDDLAERTGGNPYFAQELIVAKQQGLTTLPSSLAEFLMSRVERLDGDERTVLSALAVAGGNVEHATLDRMLPDLAIGPVVRALYDASVLVVSGTSYSFWHGLLREAILRDLLPFEAEDLHRLAAEAIEEEASVEVSPSDLARLALHWGHANNPERSLEVAVAAADASASVAAFETAADMALQALRAWPQVDSAEERAGRSRDRLLLQAIDWLADCHRGDRAIELATEALAGWGSGLPPGRRALLLAQMAPIEFRLGNPAKSTELLAEAAQLVAEEVSPEAAQVHHRISMQALEEAQIQPALEAAERAIAVASTHGPQAVLVEAMATKALTIGVIGEYEEGLALVREARKLALVDGLVSVAAQTYRTEMIIIEFRHGRTDAAMSALEQGLAHANRHCGPRWRARFQHDLCNLYIDAGRFLDAEPLLNDLLATTVNDLRRLSAGAGCLNSLCDTAVAWHLDQVIDVSGNVAQYHFWEEPQWYEPKYNGGSLANRKYEASINPRYVDYGRRFGNAAAKLTQVVPYRVKFDYANRVDANGVYADTPTDLSCGQNDNCADGAPGFYSVYRLLQVTTQVRKGDGSGMRNVRWFRLNHQFPTAPNEGNESAKSGRKLWLASIDPGDENPVVYHGGWKDNRVNHPNGVSRMQTLRVTKVVNESGGYVNFTYGQSHAPQTGSCSTTNTSNIRRNCDMYVAWDAHTGSGGWVWWHKWKITKTVEGAGAGQGGSALITKTYSYPKPPEWAYAGKTGMGVHHSSQCRYGYGCNVWNDYRGHRQVNVTDATGARVEHYFYTGMENDRAYPTGTTGWLKDSPNAHNHSLITVVDGGGATRANKFELAGRSAGVKVFNALGQRTHQSRVHYNSAKVTDKNSTANRFILYPISYRTTSQNNVDWTFNEPGSTGTNWLQATTHFDNKGRVIRVNDYATNPAGDETTTFTSYAESTAGDRWFMSTPLLVATKAGLHSGGPGWGNWLSATAYLYDNQAYGVAPTFGRVTTQHQQFEIDGNNNPVWANTKYQYNANGAVNRVTVEGDPGTDDDQITITRYDATYGYVSSTNGPLGSQDNYTYVVDPAHGQPTSVGDPNGGTTTLTYDSQGRLKTVRPPNYPAATVKYTYSVNQNAVDVVKTEALRQHGAGGDSYVQSWDFFDGLGRHIQSQGRHRSNNNTVNVTSSTKYDNVGRVQIEVDPAFRSGAPGNFWAVNWSSINKPHRRISYPVDASADPQYNAGCKTGANTTVVHYGADNQNWDSTRTSVCGLVTRTWDMGNHRTTTTTNTKGNVLSIVNPAGDTTRYEYSRKDQLTKVTDPVGNVTQYYYDRQNAQPTRLKDPDLGTINYGYDRHSRLKAQVDARNVRLEVTWDKGNRPTNLRRSGTDVSRWTYDPAGAAGQLYEERHWNRDLNGTETGWSKKTHAYNNRQQVKSTTWQTTGLAGGSQKVSYAYRDSGAVDTITYPNGAVVDYRYNRIEQQDRVQVNGAHVGRWIDYDAAARPIKIYRGTEGTANNLFTQRSYDANTNRLSTLVTTNNSGAKVQDFAYSYTVEGLISQIKDKSVVDGQAVDQSSCYRYDDMHQLTRAWTRGDHNCANTSMGSAGPDPYVVTYDHNKIGGITRATGAGTVGGDYTYPNPGQARPHAPTTAGGHSYTYDAAGNRKTHVVGGQTTTYTYDVQNRLIAIGGAGEGAGSKFLYDTSGARVRRIVPGEPTVWYLGAGYEVDSTGSTTVHVSIAGQTVGAVTDGIVWTTAADHLGSASFSASATGSQNQRYMPFGGIRGAAGHTQPTDRGYTGQLNDHTGLYHYNARYYDPVLHQFTQPDTIVPSASLSTDWNRYTYVRNNPMTYTDPTGHCVGGMDCDSSPVDDSTMARCGFDGSRCGNLQEGRNQIRIQNANHNPDPSIKGVVADEVFLAVALTVTGLEIVADSAACVSGLGFNWETGLDCGAVFLPVVNSRIDDAVQGAAAALKRSDSAPNAARHLCSFSGETEVLMADGTTKPISQIEVGDWVLAEDPETGERGAREVTHLWVHEDTIIDLEIDGNDFATTEDHPFWNQTDGEWQPASALNAGDLVLTAGRATLTVDGMDWGSARTTVAYNLTVDDIHTYFVLVDGDAVLVHNTCLPRFDGPKPSYHVNPAHVPGQGLRPGKTPLPADAEDVFRTAVPDDALNPRAWFGLNTDGQIYRFSPGGDGTAHFSGIDGVGDGVRNLTPYARGRLDALGG